ncbi:MAG: CoA pyrophosphatase [Acidobacteria bacterium]|nr:CoA pyrophosphatase [Acidobacteriota bacterium]MCW5967112.1 CoA pyrophosphatase [Blastocatellales bacterium]
MSELDRICERLRGRMPDLSGLTTTQKDRFAGTTQAAVAVLLRELSGETQFLVIERARNPRDHWSGHLALPGGRRDPADRDLLDTAAREVFEEVGIHIPDRSAFIAELGSISPGNPRLPRISVTPFVALAPPEFIITLSAEVSTAFWVSANELKSAGARDEVSLVVDGIRYRWPAYATERGPIWGITERILTEFLAFLD